MGRGDSRRMRGRAGHGLGMSLKKIVRANLRRAIIIALVVGTALLLINHGDHLGDEPVCSHFYLKACGMYAVPFLVSIVSAIFAARES